MKCGRQVVVGGLRVKATWSGEYTSLVLIGPGGLTVFRGAIIFSMWDKIKKVLDSVAGENHGNRTDLDEVVDA